jgi:hypothetical protein
MEINNLTKCLSYTTDSQIILTYSNHNAKHGICGHLFEVIDYYIFLNQFFTCEILISEDIPSDELKIALSKYDRSKVKNINFQFYRPTIYNCPNSIIIFTDGYLPENTVFKTKKIILFPCGKKDFTDISKKIRNNVLIMVDKRLNYIIPEDIESIDYIKKINFNILTQIKREPDHLKKLPNTHIMYATSNCRLVQEETILEYASILDHASQLIVLLNKTSPLIDTNIWNKQIQYKIVPIENLFEFMDTFVYTGTYRKWDCSPRMIAECKYFGVPVIYTKNIDQEYLKEDLGLMVRFWDTETKLDSLNLTETDLIVDICKKYLSED